MGGGAANRRWRIWSHLSRHPAILIQILSYKPKFHFSPVLRNQCWSRRRLKGVPVPVGSVIQLKKKKIGTDGIECTGTKCIFYIPFKNRDMIH